MLEPGPIRTLIFLPADPQSEKIGGIQSFVKGFIRLAPPEFEIELVGCSSDPDRRPIGRWQPLSVMGRGIRFLPVTHAPPPHRRSRIPIALRFALACWRFRARIDGSRGVLQFHRAGAPLAFICASAMKIQVVHLNVAEIDSAGGESRWRFLPGLYHRIEALTLRRMSRIYVVNQAGVSFYKRRHPEIADRVEFLPTWVDEALFNVATSSRRREMRARALEDLGVPEDARLILFVGRFEEQKDPLLVLRSADVALTAEPNRHFVMIGDGGLRRSIERAIATSRNPHRIHMLGFQPPDAIAQFMTSADTLLLASRFEGMPITVLEALATGLPVVSTAVGEVPRLVRTGATGELVGDRRPENLADAIARVLSRPRESYADAARQAVEPYLARNVLPSFYEAHRLVAGAEKMP